LAAELSSEWVYNHRGMGSQEELQRFLPSGHILLDVEELAGPRNLLDQIFDPHTTPSLTQVLRHPWVHTSHLDLQVGVAANQDVRKVLEELRPQGSDPRKDSVAWIPLVASVCVEGRPPPFEKAKEIIDIAVSLSDGHFRLDGCKQRRYPSVQDGSPPEDIQEWSIIVCDTEEDGDTTSAHYHDGSPTGAGFPDVSHMHGTNPLAAHHNEASPSDVNRSYLPNSPTGPATSGRKSFTWQTLRTRLVLDRFCIQVRYKEDLNEDDPEDVWWLRLKWLPPMVAGRKDTLGSLAMFRHRLDGRLGLAECGSFVLLQQLLLAGRNEVTKRQHAMEQAQRRSKPAPAGLMLPLFR